MGRKKQEPQLIIDPEFESLIPPLSAEEYTQLKDNIKSEENVHDPIMVWVERSHDFYDLSYNERKKQLDRLIIVDGHNRSPAVVAVDND